MINLYYLKGLDRIDNTNYLYKNCHILIYQSAKSILHLLRLQVKQVRETKPEDRENAVYLQDISLDKNKSDVYAPDISTVRHLFISSSIYCHADLFSCRILLKFPCTEVFCVISRKTNEYDTLCTL